MGEMALTQETDSLVSQDEAQAQDVGVRPLRVCLMSEGSYPHRRGGVGTWADMLIRGLPQVHFSLISLVDSPSAQVAYDLPDNVTDLVTVPVWGTSGALELQRELSLREVIRAKRPLPEHVVENNFIPLFRRWLELIWSEEGDVDETAVVLRAMRDYFRLYDYDATMRSRAVWQCFLSVSPSGYERVEVLPTSAAPVSLRDLTDAMRLMYRWLTVLTVRIPEADVVHATAAGLTGLLGILATEDRRTAFVLSEHGIYLREILLALSRSKLSRFAQQFQAQFTQRITETSYAYAQRITPCSDYNQRWELYKGAWPANLQTVHNGVDATQFYSREHELSEDTPPTAIWLGRIDPLKDVETLIRAVALVREALPDVRFVLYGKAPEGNEWYYDRCVALRDELGLADHVIFAGFTSSPADAYNEGDISVLSSISEGFPYTVIESMMCGIPVVATDVGGVKEAVGDCGHVVEPRNPEAFADACVALMSDRARAREVGRRARERAMELFTLERCNMAFLDVYTQMAEGVGKSEAVLRGLWHTPDPLWLPRPVAYEPT